MTYYISWLLLFFASCSGVPVQHGALGPPILPAFPWLSSVQTKEPMNIKLTHFPGSGEFSPVRQGREDAVFVDHEILSPELNQVVAQTSNSHNGGEVLLTLPDTDVLSYLDTAALSTKPEGMAQSPLSPLKSTSAESSTVLSSSAEPSVLARASELSDPAAGELSGPLGGTSAIGHSRHRPEPGLAPAEQKLSSRRGGVPQLEMLESQSKPRKGVPERWESVLTVTGRKPSSRRTGAPDLEMLENPSKPRKGAPPPPPPSDGDTEADTGGGHWDAADPPQEPTLDPSVTRQQAAMANLAKARVSMMVGATFGVLSLLVLAWYGIRRVSDSWHHRQYRKVDFLIDGMYNM